MAAKLAEHYLLVSVQLLDGRVVRDVLKARRIATTRLLRSRVCYNPPDFLSAEEFSWPP
jgi:hypothetical protein